MKEKLATRLLLTSIALAGCGDVPEVVRVPTPPPSTEPAATPGTPPHMQQWTRTPIFTKTATIIIYKSKKW